MGNAGNEQQLEARDKGYSAPPPVNGLVDPTIRDVPRIVWWGRAGFLHGAKRKASPLPLRMFSGYMVAVWRLSLWLVFPVQLALVARRSSRYYLTPERDAVLAITAGADGWHEQPGTKGLPPPSSRLRRQMITNTLSGEWSSSSKRSERCRHSRT